MTAQAAGGDNDFLVNYEVDDHASKVLADINAMFDKTQEAIIASNSELKQYEQQVAITDQKQAAMGATIGVVAGIVTSFTTAAISQIQKVVAEVIQFGEASIEVRKRLDTLDVSVQNIGKNAGYTQQQMEDFEKSITDRGIKISAAREALIKLTESEVDLSKASQLAAVAQDAAAIKGISTADALQRITGAIERQSPMMLKTLGLTVSMASANASYAAQLGKTANELNDVEKKQALMNAVLKAGTLIAGTNEAATKTVGNAEEERAVQIEKLQNAIGGLFQPAYFQQIKFFNSLLEDLNKFLEDNADTLNKVSREAADLFTAAIDVAQPFIMIIEDVLKAIGDIILAARDADIAFMGLFGAEAQSFAKDYYARLFDINSILTTITKLAILTGGVIAGMEARAGTIVEQFTAVTKLAAALASGDIKKIQAAADELSQAKKDFLGGIDVGWQAQAKYMKDAIDQMPELVNGYGDVAKAADDAGTAAENAAQKLADAVAQTSMKLKDLQDKLTDQEIDRQIKLQRSIIEDQIKEQWAAEDRERAHTERLNDIFKNAEDQKTQVLQQVSEQKVQIETDYRKRLQEIQRNFELDAAEFARKRDAIGLLALIRQNKRQLDNEKRAHDDSKKQVDERYKKALADIDKNVQDQIKKLDEAYDKELEAYQRQLDRQKVLKDLHNQWEQEDRDRAQRKALEDIIKFYYGLDGATKEGLGNLLKDWNWYFTQIDEALAQYNMRATAGTTAANDQVMRNLEKKYNEDLNGDGVIGQAGIVSQMLAPTYLTPSMAGNGATRVPAVNPNGRGSMDYREIHLSGDVSGLDPYLQRVLVNSMLEIERNRG